MNKTSSLALLGAFFLGSLSAFAQGASPSVVQDEPAEAAVIVSRH